MSNNLQNKWRNLWVFGDSYTTPYECVDPADSFWGLTAQWLNIPVVKNLSRRGASLESVSQLLITQQQQYDWQRDFFIVGIPPVQRFLACADDSKLEYSIKEFETETWTESSRAIIDHQGLRSFHGWELPKNVAVNRSSQYIETQAMREIFWITQWLSSHCANYVVVNLSCDLNKFNPAESAQFLLEYCVNHSNCILFDKTYYGINLDVHRPPDFDQYGWNGHHGAEGNKYFFEQSLKPYITELLSTKKEI